MAIAEIMARHQRDVLRMNPFMFHRRDALLVLLREWGVTIEELLTVTADQVDPPPRNKLVAIRGIRYPYTPAVHAASSRWIRQRAAMNSKVRTPLLFVDQRGRPMAADTVRRLIKELAGDLYDPAIHRGGLGAPRNPAVLTMPRLTPLRKGEPDGQ